MSHGVVCKYHYRGKLSLWLTSVTVWLILREGVAKSPCRCGSIAEIYTFYAFPQVDARKISSINMLERLNWEIRHRTGVVGIFPNTDAYTRLVTTYLMKYAENWFVSRAYLSEQSVRAMLRPAA